MLCLCNDVGEGSGDGHRAKHAVTIKIDPKAFYALLVNMSGNGSARPELVVTEPGSENIDAVPPAHRARESAAQAPSRWRL
jgi:hypothetical protein